MRPSILHITTFLQGGAGRVLCDLARYQRQHGYRVTVVMDDSPVPGYENYPEYLALLEECGIRVLSLHATFRRDTGANLRAARRVRERLSDEPIDLIHAHAAVPALIGLIARSGLLRRVPVVLSMQGWGNNKTPEQESADVATMNLLDAVFPVSQSAAGLLERKGVAPHLLHVIPNAVDARGAPPADSGQRAAIERWRAGHKRLIGCIGSLCERKDQATLIRALAMMRTQADATLVLIGEGDDAALRESAESLGIAERVVFAGYLPDAGTYLAHFDVLVLPSRSEGLPLVVLEAFREGVPVIASDIPEIAEIVKDGETGRLFPAGDASRLASTLQEVLEEDSGERDRRVRSARRLLEDKYLAEAMCASYMEQYRRAGALSD